MCVGFSPSQLTGFPQLILLFFWFVVSRCVPGIANIEEKAKYGVFILR